MTVRKYATAPRDIQNLAWKDWERFTSTKVTACIPIIGLIVGIKAYTSLKKQMVVIDFKAGIEQGRADSEVNASLENVLKDYLKAGIVHNVLSIAALTHLLALQAIPLLLGQVLIIGSILALIMLVYRLVEESTPSAEELKRAEWRAAMKEFAAVCEEQAEDIRAMKHSLLHLLNEANLLNEKLTALLDKRQAEHSMNVQHNSPPLNPKELKKELDEEKFLEELKDNLRHYPELPERMRLYDVTTVRAVLVERIEHHAKLQVAIQTALMSWKDQSDDGGRKLERLEAKSEAI